MTGKTKGTTVQALLRKASMELKPKRITCAADKDLGELEAGILLASVVKKDRTWLFAHPETAVASKNEKCFREFVGRRKKHEPIAYILLEKEFYGLPFKVNRSTLIPRPESEMLVDFARKTLFPNPSMTDVVWDVGTGSGALAISIAKHIGRRRVIATDISTKALTVAKLNAKRLKTKNVTFLKADLLTPNVMRIFERIRDRRLVIVANLPYLPTSDKKKLTTDVVKFEPSNALFVGKNGTELIEKFLRQIATFDIHFASAFLEYDPPQTKKLRALAKLLFPRATIRTHRDLAKRDRVLEITRAPE